MLRLAIPVVIVQVGTMAMGVVDTVMAGHISAQALAAVALGNLYILHPGRVRAGDAHGCWTRWWPRRSVPETGRQVRVEIDTPAPVMR